MKNLMKIALVATCLVLPAQVFADHHMSMEGKDMTNCPAMADMEKMQGEMKNMMDMMSDPTMKERMQAMHDHMGSMMMNMHQMHGGIMGGANDMSAEKCPAGHSCDKKDGHSH